MAHFPAEISNALHATRTKGSLALGVALQELEVFVGRVQKALDRPDSLSDEGATSSLLPTKPRENDSEKLPEHAEYRNVHETGQSSRADVIRDGGST